MFRKKTSSIHSQLLWQLNYLFWPDLASSNYYKDSLKRMEKYVNNVDKESNPPNVPQVQPIENFWGHLAQKVTREVGKLQQSKSLLIAAN